MVKTFIGEAKILSAPMGKIVKNLMDEGGKLGVSSRGMGSLDQKMVQIMSKMIFILQLRD